jgi:hypothetical protein
MMGITPTLMTKSAEKSYRYPDFRYSFPENVTIENAGRRKPD